MAFLKKINVDSLKETVGASVNAAKEGIANIDVDALKDSVKESVEASVKAAQDGVSNITVDGIVQGAKDAAATGAEMLSDTADGIARKVSGAEMDAETDASVKELIALLWCLAYVDGVVSDEERKTLAELSEALDSKYSEYAAEHEQEYIAKLQDASSEFGHQNAAKIEAQKIIERTGAPSEDAKLLCWNLLALANADGLDESEIDFIRFVGEKAGIDPAVFEELRNYSDAIAEIGESLDKLRLSDKSYTEIEPLVAEFTHRQQELFEAVQALIADR